MTEFGLNNSKDLNANSENTDDLLQAIKQVAKEMAEAVKLSQKQVIKDAVNETVKNITTNQNKMSIIQPSKINIDQMITEGKVERVGGNRNNRYSEDEDYNYSYQDSTFSGNKSFYDKEIQAHNSLQHRLELLRNKKIADEMKKYSDKPKLSQNTKRIIKEKFANDKPIYERTEEVLKIKEAKLEMLKNVYKEIEMMEEMEHRSRFNTQGYASQEFTENFFNDQMLWQKNKEEKMAYIRNEIEKLESEASKSLYKPTITKASDDIAKTQINKLKEKEVHSRLYNLHEEAIMKKELMQIKAVPNFTPVINKRPPNFKKKDVYTKRDITPLKPSSKAVVKKESYPRKLNNSAMDMRNETNSNKDSCKDFQNETDLSEDPLITQYRLHLEKSHHDSSPVNEFMQAKTKIMNNGKMAEGKNKNRINPQGTSWQNELDKINDQVIEPDESYNKLMSLYKLNVGTASIWNKNNENKIIVTPKFPGGKIKKK